MNTQPAQSLKYLLYARKSTEDEERQQLSIPAQVDEVRKLAKVNNLHIITELTEKKSAKTPGRPIFNQMLKMIDNGQADAVISWHPDRLARNALDAGRLFYLLDQGKLKDLKFVSFRFDNDPNGRFMLSIAFGQSQYFSDSLSVNTKRGLIAKCKSGWRPGKAPFGYRNAIRNGIKIIVPVKKEAALVKQVFQNYAIGNWSLIKVQNFLTQNGVKGLRRDNVRGKADLNTVSKILANQFYVGQFYFADQIWTGKHQPIIDKELFAKVQEVLHSKSPMRQEDKKINFRKHRFPFSSFIKCSQCDRHITAEQHTKYYHTSGNHQIFVYYVCHSQKSSKLPSCHLPIIRELKLLKLFPPVLKQLSFNRNHYRKMLSLMAADKLEISQNRNRLTAVLQMKIKDIKSKLNTLVDLYLDGNLDKQIYQDKRRFLTTQLHKLESQLENNSLDIDQLLQPLQQFFDSAYQRGIMAADLEQKLAAGSITPSDFTAVPNYLINRAKQKKRISADRLDLPDYPDYPDSAKPPFPNSNLQTPDFFADGKVNLSQQISTPEISPNRQFLLRLDDHLRQMQNTNSNLTLTGNSLVCRGQNQWAALARRPTIRSAEPPVRIGLTFAVYDTAVLPLN